MKIIIGTANFLKEYGLKKNFVNKKETIKILKYAHQKKIFNIDTAYEYDNFSDLNDKINFKEYNISTKFNFKNKIDINNKYKENFLNLLKKKLLKLKIKNFDSFFIHNFEKLNKNCIISALNFLRELKKKKYIKKIGISIYSEQSLKKINYCGNVDIIQLPINIFDRRFVSSKLVSFLKKKILKYKQDQFFYKVYF